MFITHKKTSRKRKKTLCLNLSTLCMVVAAIACLPASSTARQVMPGDAVQLDYTCRLANGKILVTTRQDAVSTEGAALSHAFVAMKRYTPAVVVAGNQTKSETPADLQPLKKAAAMRLAEVLAGKTYGHSYTVSLSAEAIEGLSAQERSIEFARTMQRPKQRIIPVEQFIRLTGEEPKTGQRLFEDTDVQWQVANVGDDGVAVRYLVKDGQNVDTPYGKAVFRDRGEHYDLEIDAREGNLVRVGPYVGQIAGVGEKLFTVDFAHPFGGRRLECTFTVNENATPGNAATGGEAAQ